MQIIFAALDRLEPIFEMKLQEILRSDIIFDTKLNQFDAVENRVFRLLFVYGFQILDDVGFELSNF